MKYRRIKITNKRNTYSLKKSQHDQITKKFEQYVERGRANKSYKYPRGDLPASEKKSEALAPIPAS